MATKIQLMEGVEIDLNEGLERGDLIDGQTQETYHSTEETDKRDAEAAQRALEAGENAAVEGKAAEVKPAVTTKEEDKTPTAEAEALQVFKIKYEGVEKELKLTPEQLINRLQKAEDYDTKMARLAEDRRAVEPFKHVLDTPWFKQKLEEGLAAGEIERPAQVAPAAEEDVFELERRKMDPDFEGVRAAMRAWAITLPITMQFQLDNNVSLFNKEYDRVAAKLRAPRHTPPPNLTAAQTKVVDKVIERKEVAKSAARVESPGSAPEITPDRAKANRVRELKKAMKDGTKRDEAAAEFLLITQFSD